MTADQQPNGPSAPTRIVRSRVKGWRMPANTKYVGRPSQWGNPFTLGFTKVFVNNVPPYDRVVITPVTAEEVVAAFRWLSSQHVDLIRSELAGLNLACWCPLDQACHADVLLELANCG